MKKSIWLLIPCFALLFPACDTDDRPGGRLWYCYYERICGEVWNHLPGETEEQITQYLRAHDVKVLQFETRLVPACMAMVCSCGSGRAYRVKIPGRDAERLENLPGLKHGVWYRCREVE